MEHFWDGFRNFANFSGRATRTQYWMFILFYMLAYIGLSVIDALLGTFVLAGIFSLVMLIPAISYATRRLHDTGRTGWWQLIAFIPLIGAIVLLIFLVQKSHGANQYGEPVSSEPAVA